MGTNAASLAVAVAVTDVDEPPVLSGPTSLEVVENEKGAIATYAAADPEGEEVAWAVAGEDRDPFVIEGRRPLVCWATKLRIAGGLQR